jgi:hypothetical protein
VACNYDPDEKLKRFQPVIRLYSVPMTAFTGEDEGDEEGVLEGDEHESTS